MTRTCITFITFLGSAAVDYGVSWFDRLGVCLSHLFTDAGFRLRVVDPRLLPRTTTFTLTISDETVATTDNLVSKNLTPRARVRAHTVERKEGGRSRQRSRLLFRIRSFRGMEWYIDLLPSTDKVNVRHVPGRRRKAVTHCSPRRREGYAGEGHDRPFAIMADCRPAHCSETRAATVKRYDCIVIPSSTT